MSDALRAVVHLPAENGLPGFGERHREYAASLGRGVEWRSCPDLPAFLDALPESDIAVTWQFRREWLEKAGRLKVLATPAAGREWIEPRSGNGLEVIFGTFHGELMAETVIGLMLAFCRGIKSSLDRQAEEPWARLEVASSMRQLRGSRVVILGFGHIGKWVARLLKPFGARVRGVNRSDMSRPDFLDREDEVAPVSMLDAILPDTDHLVLALPGGPGSDGIIDARRLAMLPKSSYVYNIGRGNAIDANALAAALKSGAVAGAGLDVFETEPMPADNPLRGCPNVILMPHVSAFASTYHEVFLREFVDKLTRHFAAANRR